MVEHCEVYVSGAIRKEKLVSEFGVECYYGFLDRSDFPVYFMAYAPFTRVLWGLPDKTQIDIEGRIAYLNGKLIIVLTKYLKE